MSNVKALFAFDGKTIEEPVSFEPIFNRLWSGNWHSGEKLLDHPKRRQVKTERAAIRAEDRTRNVWPNSG
jgi:hypothetical protein